MVTGRSSQVDAACASGRSGCVCSPSRHSSTRCAQRVGDRVLALAGDDLAQLGLEVEDLEAVRAAVEMALDVHAELALGLAVEVRVHLAQDVVAVTHGSLGLVCRLVGRFGSSAAHRSCQAAGCARSAKPNNRRSSPFLPRWRRLITVPIGMSRISAISLYEKPSTSARRTATRNCSGRSSSASFTSVVGEPLEQLVLGAATGHRRLETTEPAVHVEVLDVVEVGLARTALLGSVGVDERVREDAEEPRLEVRALFEAAERAVGLEVGLLHEILGVGRVAGHAQRTRVERRHELHRLLGEPRLVSHGAHATGRMPVVRRCRHVARRCSQHRQHTAVLGLGRGQAELREHRRDVLLDGSLGDHELARDPDVRSSLGHERRAPRVRVR